MKKFTILPHLILLSPILFLMVIGILTNSGAIGMALGKIAGVAIDSSIYLPAILVGFIFKDYKKLLVFGIVVNLFTYIYALEQITDWHLIVTGTELNRASLFASRFFAFFIIVHLVNLPIIWYQNKKIYNQLNLNKGNSLKKEYQSSYDANPKVEKDIIKENLNLKDIKTIINDSESDNK